jgi:hypothetical protein
MRAIARLAGLTMVLALVGCYPHGDWWMHVHNGTDERWLIRVQFAPDDPQQMVAMVDPGATGPAVEWQGGREVTVEVLTLPPECTVVGTFRQAEGDKFVVDAVPGLTGELKTFTTPWGANRAAGIRDLSSCGGMPGAPYLGTPAPGYP